MPYIKTTANLSIPQDKMIIIKENLGKEIAILDKVEQWLMVDFCENSPLYFQGNNQPAAMVQVELFGESQPDACSRMTAAITRILTEQLPIPADRIFVNYSEHRYWGWNGTNF